MKTKLTCIALNSAPHRFPWYWTIHIDTCLNWIKNQSIFLWFTSLDSRKDNFDSIKHVKYYYLLSYYCLLDIGIRIWKIYKIVVDKWHSCYNHYAYKQTMSACFFIMFWRKQFYYYFTWQSRILHNLYSDSFILYIANTKNDSHRYLICKTNCRVTNTMRTKNDPKILNIKYISINSLRYEKKI